MFGTRPFAAARGARMASALLCCRPWPRPRPRGACRRTAPARSCTPLPACLAAELSVHRALRLGRARLGGLVESEGVLLPRANPAGSHRRIPASACAAIRRIHALFHGRPGHGPAQRLGTGRPDPSLQYLHPHRLLQRHRRLRLPVRPRAHPRRSRARTRAPARPFLGRSSSGRTRRSGCGRSWGGRAAVHAARPVRDGDVAAAVGAEKPDGGPIAPPGLKVDAPEPAVFLQGCGRPRAPVI